MDHRQHAPATERNRDPILAVLRRVLPAAGSVLEISSGTGQHAAHFGRALPDLRWQPSEANLDSHASIRAWTNGIANVLPPVRIDVTDQDWGVPVYDALFNANMIHIAPWDRTAGLLRGASAHLIAGAPLVMYGPFMVDGQHTAPSNAAFDAQLRAQDPRWGVRDLALVTKLAAEHGFDLQERIDMPANNQILVFRLTASPRSGGNPEPAAGDGP